jgi:hypothetical protein
MCHVRLSALVLCFGFLAAGCDRVTPRAVSEDPFPCTDQDWSSARTNAYRFIAHAGGEIDGRRYTNSREALDLAYANGLRLFEIDLIATSDDHIVGAHDWGAWQEATGSETTHPTHRQFKETPLFGKYQGLDLADLDRWFTERPDAYLVTDKITDFPRLLEKFPHASRLIVEVFSVDDYHRAIAQGIRYPMLSLIPALANDGEEKVRELLETEPVKFVAIPTKAIRRQSRLLRRLRRNAACVYAFTSSDAGFLEPNFRTSIFGVYADSWAVRHGACDAPVCDTY